MLLETQPGLIGKRYLLQSLLGKGGMGAVYKAQDRLTGQSIALKRVFAPAEQLLFSSTSASMDSRLALAKEFRLLASLRHPNIISVLDYGFDEERQPYFTLDLLERASTILEAGRDLPLEGKVNIIIQMLHALAYLHRRGILHRDLKPSNVLVAEKQIKVLDFGLSVIRGQVEPQDGSMVGTLSYLAPEVLSGEIASAASDLYAVGIIAYELFSNRHPFNTDSITQLIDSILHKPPDIAALTVDQSIKVIVERLLAKNPEDRYNDATQVISALYTAIGQSPPPESSAIRESFLEAAQLIGRDRELAQISTELTRALSGHGSAWLLGGESGVGKSRLLNEMRTLALVQGALVLRGQATSEAVSLYQIWRDALRWLALISDLSNEQASILKSVVTDIEALLNHPVADAPELDPQTTQTRLFQTIEAMFRQQKQPVVVILEDCQWAGTESLSLLKHLTEILSDLPLILIGSYRDDEKPDLPTLLPAMQIMPLKRLSDASIAELSESMLGSIGRQTEIVNFLKHETEGNVFFLVEVVRALAEEAGQLENIGMITLPQHLFVGGIQRIVQRRINRIAPENLPLLRYASVVGRQLDLSILRVLSPETALETWLSECASAAVIEVQDEQWRFAHDKLRESLLGDLASDERIKLHSRVADVMEVLYQNVADQIPSLAYHFFQGEQWNKAIEYLSRAGDNAARLNAHVEARDYYRQTLEALAHLPENEERMRIRVDTLTKIASVSFVTDVPEKNLERLGEAEALLKTLAGPDGQPGTDQHRLARVHYWMGRVYFYRNQPREAVGYYQQVLAVGRQVGDEQLLAIPSNVIGQVLAIQGQFGKALPLLAQSMALLEKIANWSEWIRAIAYHGAALVAHGQIADGLAESRRGLAKSEELKDWTNAGFVHLILASSGLHSGDIQLLYDEAQAAITIAEETNSGLQVYLGFAYRAWAESRMGQHTTAAASMAQATAITQRLGGRLILADLFAASNAELSLNAEHPEEAIKLAEAAVTLAKTVGGVLAEGIAERVWSLALAKVDASRTADIDQHFAASANALQTGESLMELARTELAWGATCQDLSAARAHLEKAAAQFEIAHQDKELAYAQQLIASRK